MYVVVPDREWGFAGRFYLRHQCARVVHSCLLPRARCLAVIVIAQPRSCILFRISHAVTCSSGCTWEHVPASVVFPAGDHDCPTMLVCPVSRIACCLHGTGYPTPRGDRRAVVGRGTGLINACKLWRAAANRGRRELYVCLPSATRDCCGPLSMM